MIDLPRCGLCGALQRQQRQVDHHGLLGFLAISRTGVVPGNAPLWRLAKSAAAGGYAACASSKAIASMARMEYMTSRLRYRGRAMAPAAPSAKYSGMKCSSRSEEHTSELQSPCNLVC